VVVLACRLHGTFKLAPDDVTVTKLDSHTYLASGQCPHCLRTYTREISASEAKALEGRNVS